MTDLDKAVALLDQANVPRKDRMFWIVLSTPEDEQRYAELKVRSVPGLGWGWNGPDWGLEGLMGTKRAWVGWGQIGPVLGALAGFERGRWTVGVAKG